MNQASDHSPARLKPTIKVAAGVVVEEDRLLITQRTSGFWEFPGGKLEQGESPRQALKRELMEELGVSVLVGDQLMIVDHSDNHRRIILHTFFCSLESGRPTAVDVVDLAWVRPDELQKYDLLAADRQIATRLNQRPG